MLKRREACSANTIWTPLRGCWASTRQRGRYEVATIFLMKTFWPGQTKAVATGVRRGTKMGAEGLEEEMELIKTKRKPTIREILKEQPTHTRIYVSKRYLPRHTAINNGTTNAVSDSRARYHEIRIEILTCRYVVQESLPFPARGSVGSNKQP